MWPFGSRRIGSTVAERRKDKTSKIVSVADAINRMQARIVWIERNAPYETSDSRRKRLEVEKLQLEEKIKALERKHHALAARLKG